MLERLLKTHEVAELVGFAPGTIQDWAENDDLPSFKLGGKLRFRESEVAAWIEGRRRGVPGVPRGERHIFPSTEPPAIVGPST